MSRPIALDLSDRHEAPPSESGLVPAVVKAVAVIRRLNERAPRGASLAEIVVAEGISRSHCHNILRTFAAGGWVVYVPAERVYRLGPGLLADSSSLLQAGESLAELRPFLTRLARELHLPCVLSRLEAEGSFTVIDKVDGSSELGLSVPIGHRFPPDSPAQRKAAIAWQSDQEIAAWLAEWRPVAYTPASIIDKQAMTAELLATRARGYARSVGEFLEAVMSLALPIYDRAGRVAMLLQCPGLVDQVRLREAEVARALTRAVAEIHGFTGGRPPRHFPRG